MAYKEVQKNFNPAMGYVSRSNIRDLTADLGYTYFFGGEFLQSVFAGVDGQRIDVIDEDLQSEVFVYRLAELQTNTRDILSVSYTTNREVVQRSFALYNSPVRQVAVLPGNYAFNEYQLAVNTEAKDDMQVVLVSLEVIFITEPGLI